jgi:Tol biopolymer transport system component
MNPNAMFERDLERWLDAEARGRAPEGLHAAVIERARTLRQRRNWSSALPAHWFGRNKGITLFAAAALLVVGGAAAIGAGLLRLPSTVPTQPVPSLAAVVTNPTAEPTSSPSPVPSATPVVPPRAPSWTATGNMIAPRSGSAAVLLPDGKVLVMGGDTALASAELYDPATGTWTATGSMVSNWGAGAGYAHFTATVLRDGKVLVAGGANGSGSLASAELYDPATGTWAATGSMITPRADHTATLLSDGRVLVAGGQPGRPVASAELYDPATGTWTATGSMGTVRAEHTATLLTDGRVLVAGGIFSPEPWSSSLLTSAELYDPGTGTWTYARSMVLRNDGGQPSGGPTALLPDGRVLLGGDPPQLYDPNTRSWTATGGKVITSFGGPDVLLADGGVLALGAAKPGEDTPTRTAAYLFDPGAGSWTPAGKLDVHRYGYTATLLPDGKVLVAGGSDANAADPNAALATAELFDPGTWSPSPIAPATPAPSPTSYAAQPAGSMFAYLQGGRLWVANRDGTRAHELLPDFVGNPGSPAWSSDGTRLVFSMTRDGDPNGVSRLYLTDASGSASQLVDTGCVAPCTGDSNPAFSSDGMRLVFVRTVTVPPASTKPVAASGGEVAGDRPATVIATIDLTIGKVTELASTTMADCPLLPGQRVPGLPNCGGFADHDPRWSPDGTQIVFTQDVPYDSNGLASINGLPGPNWPRSSIFVVGADGGNLHRVAQGGWSADWSPDGSRIVFQALPNGVPVPNPGSGTGYTVKGQIAGISTVRPDGTDQRLLTSDRNSNGPSWTADGRIWFVRTIELTGPNAHLENQLWIMGADGSNAMQVSVASQLPLFNPYGRPTRP